MFEAFTNRVQTLAQNTAIVFDTIKFKDCRVLLNSAGNTITIATPGRYMLSFDGIGGSSTAATPFTIQMYINGEPKDCAITTNTVATANEAQPLSFNVLLSVNNCCYCVDNSQQIQFLQTNAAAGELSHANVTVIRL